VREGVSEGVSEGVRASESRLACSTAVSPPRSARGLRVCGEADS
jgi:hypothetical protein